MTIKKLFLAGAALLSTATNHAIIDEAVVFEARIPHVIVLMKDSPWPMQPGMSQDQEAAVALQQEALDSWAGKETVVPAGDNMVRHVYNIILVQDPCTFVSTYIDSPWKEILFVNSDFERGFISAKPKWGNEANEKMREALRVENFNTHLKKMVTQDCVHLKQQHMLVDLGYSFSRNVDAARQALRVTQAVFNDEKMLDIAYQHILDILSSNLPSRAGSDQFIIDFIKSITPPTPTTIDSVADQLVAPVAWYMTHVNFNRYGVMTIVVRPQQFNALMPFLKKDGYTARETFKKPLLGGSLQLEPIFEAAQKIIDTAIRKEIAWQKEQNKRAFEQSRQREAQSELKKAVSEGEVGKAATAIPEVGATLLQRARQDLSAAGAELKKWYKKQVGPQLKPALDKLNEASQEAKKELEAYKVAAKQAVGIVREQAPIKLEQALKKLEDAKKRVQQEVQKQMSNIKAKL